MVSTHTTWMRVWRGGGRTRCGDWRTRILLVLRGTCVRGVLLCVEWRRALLNVVVVPPYLPTSPPLQPSAPYTPSPPPSQHTLTTLTTPPSRLPTPPTCPWRLVRRQSTQASHWLSTSGACLGVLLWCVFVSFRACGWIPCYCVLCGVQHSLLC